MNNIPIGEQQLLELFDALRHNETMIELTMANCTMGDFAAANLATALESNKCLEKLNIESNNVNPHTLIKIFEVRISFLYMGQN